MVRVRFLPILFILTVLLVGCVQTEQLGNRMPDDIMENKEAYQSLPDYVAEDGYDDVTLSVQGVSGSSHELKPDVRQFTLDPSVVREKKEPLQGMFETTLKAEYKEGEIDIRFSFRNISGEEMMIFHGSGQRYDFWILNEEGNEVYRWSQDKVFIAAIMEIKMERDAQLEFSEVWNLHDGKGQPVPPGRYTVAVQMMVDLESGAIRQDELMAKSIVDIPVNP